MKGIVFIPLGLIVLLGIAQFFQPDQINPPVQDGKDFIEVNDPPSEIATTLKVACYDCHSHETKYLWYAQVSPLSWWIDYHIQEGREHLNFSTWSVKNPKRRAHKMEACYEALEGGNMPLAVYDLMHAEAKLSEEQKQALVDYFKELEGRELQVGGN